MKPQKKQNVPVPDKTWLKVLALTFLVLAVIFLLNSYIVFNSAPKYLLSPEIGQKQVLYKESLSRMTGMALQSDDFSRVEREFSASSVQPGDVVDVDVNIYVDPKYEHTYYALEENVPSEFEILDISSGSVVENTIKFIHINSSEQATNHTFSYSVNASASGGMYSFSGSYWIEGMDAEAEMTGDVSLQVEDSAGADCTEDWGCTSWSECSGGTQTRTCTDANSCGTTDDKPPESRDCSSDDDQDTSDDYDGGSSGDSSGGSPGGSYVPPPSSQCSENWDCGLWQVCSKDGYQTRECEDLNECGTTKFKPTEMKTCEYKGSCSDNVKNGDEEGVDCGGRCSEPCSLVAAVEVPKLELDASPVNAEIFDDYVLTVTVRNVGNRTGKNILIKPNKWGSSEIKIKEIFPGEAFKVDVPLSLPGDPEKTDDTLTIHAVYKDKILEETEVPVNLSVPGYSLKIKYDKEKGKFYSVLIVDNRNQEQRNVVLDYSIDKGSESLFIDNPEVEADENKVYVRIDEIPLSDLGDGDYDVRSTFYEKGEKVWEEKTEFTLQKNRKLFNAFYISVAFMVLLVGFSTYMFYITAKQE